MGKSRLLIIGASGHGKVVADCALSGSDYAEVAFLDDVMPEGPFEYIYLGKTEEVSKYISDYDIFVAIGNCRIRERIQEECLRQKATLAIVVHPNAIVSKKATIGQGTVVMPGAVINADAKVGQGVIVNTSASVDHNCVIEDYCHIAVGARVCGAVSVGARTWIGAGSVISQCINICKDCMVGAGAVVVKDIEKTGTYVGVPARKIK